MFRLLLILFLCLIIFSSCDSESTTYFDKSNKWYRIEYRIYVDKTFTSVEIDSIKLGIDVWSKSTNGRISWQLYVFDPANLPSTGHSINDEDSPVEERVVVVNKSSSTDEWVKRKDSEFEKNFVLLGYFNGSPNDSYAKNLANIWLISDRLTNESDKAVVAAHEFGHSLDLGHTIDKNSIMSETLNDAKCLTGYDLNLFCNKHICDPLDLNQSCVMK